MIICELILIFWLGGNSRTLRSHPKCCLLISLADPQKQDFFSFWHPPYTLSRILNFFFEVAVPFLVVLEESSQFHQTTKSEDAGYFSELQFG